MVRRKLKLGRISVKFDNLPDEIGVSVVLQLLYYFN